MCRCWSGRGCGVGGLIDVQVLVWTWVWCGRIDRCAGVGLDVSVVWED